MAYSAEVIRRARERLAQAREDRESENRQHLEQAYEKCPRIRQIDLQLRRTGNGCHPAGESGLAAGAGPAGGAVF